MHSIYFGLVVHLLLVASSSSSEVKPSNKDDKVLIMFEYEPIKSEDRSKRSSTDEAVRKERQSPEVPSEYLNLLNHLNSQQQPQASASAQQSQQQLIQQLVVSRDGARQPSASRYVLSQDGRLVDESSFGLGQGQQLQSFPYYQQPQLQQPQLQQPQLQQPQLHPQQLQQFQQQFQQQQLQQLQQQQYQPQFQQSPLAQTQPQQLPSAPTTNRPGARAQVSEFTRQQQRILQEYRDAPLRAQIAGVASRPIPPLPQQVPSGPQSQSAQVFSPAPLQLQPGQVPPQFQDPNNPNIVYTLDPQGYLQQQVLQPQIPAQYADPRQIYPQGQRSGPVSQQFIYQQPIPQEITQDKIRRPINVLPSPSTSQPQQALPQQYLIETSRPSAPQPQYASPELGQQIQYVQQPQPQPQPRPQEAQQSTLLQPVAGRGLFNPVKPSRSSIFVSRSSAPRAEEVSSEKVPVVRLPSPDGQRTISKQELDALVGAGYTVSPISQEQQFLKSKRQQPLIEEGRNHVVYANPQDGVQYQYSPGSSDATATIKTKKEAPDSKYFESEN